MMAQSEKYRKSKLATPPGSKPGSSTAHIFIITNIICVSRSVDKQIMLYAVFTIFGHTPSQLTGHCSELHLQTLLPTVGSLHMKS